MECLDANDLQDLMAGALEGSARTNVLGHLDTCDDCRELLSITASDVSRQSLPTFDDGLEATAMPQDALALEATEMPTAKSPSLMATQQASDAVIGLPEDPGDAPTILPNDLIATPVLRPGAVAKPKTQGKKVGRFTTIDRLGAGAMGVVFRAEDPKLGRNVALKLLKRADASLTERLVREARSMAQVNHPNVVTVYEVGEADGGTMFIAMELVTGQSLRVWQSSQKRTVPELVEAYIAAGRGLAAAHAAGIVHRDFKPDNVLVGDDGRVRVTDFGLAAAKPGEGGTKPSPTPHIGDVNLTTSGSVMGTPAYMAPEQFAAGNVDSRTDQFNFCVALYEALYGERPFEGKSFTELGDNVMFGRVRPAPAASRVSPVLREILVRGLSAKPGDRFPTMNDLITELGRDRARPWRRTSYASAALAAALLLGLGSDWVVRDRLGSEIHQSFTLTGTQIERAVGQLRDQFDTVSQVAYRESALREVAAHHDQADFGLGSPEDDQAELERLHNTLVSTDWVRLGTSTLAIADYKGRLLYTSAEAPQWGNDLKTLPFVKRALDAGKGDSVTVMPYTDSALRASGILGAQRAVPPSQGLAVVFVRTLALGDKSGEASEARALYIQVQDGKQLLENVRLDAETQLALVGPFGDSTGDAAITPSIVASALGTRAIAEVDSGEHSYQVQARSVAGLDGQGTIGHVVMARPLDGVLSLFPGARIVFALTAFGALAVAIATWLRAREMTNGRT